MNKIMNTWDVHLLVYYTIEEYTIHYSIYTNLYNSFTFHSLFVLYVSHYEVTNWFMDITLLFERPEVIRFGCMNGSKCGD